MPGNGANFHPEVSEQQRGRPPDHLRLAIRPHSKHPFVIRGDHEGRIGRFHDSARSASDAIRAYCLHNYTATVRIFTGEAQLWREDDLALNGKVTRTCPGRPQCASSGADADLAA